MRCLSKSWLIAQVQAGSGNLLPSVSADTGHHFPVENPECQGGGSNFSVKRHSIKQKHNYFRFKLVKVLIFSKSSWHDGIS